MKIENKTYEAWLSEISRVIREDDRMELSDDEAIMYFKNSSGCILSYYDMDRNQVVYY